MRCCVPGQFRTLTFSSAFFRIAGTSYRWRQNPQTLNSQLVCPHVRHATVFVAFSFGWLFRRDAWQRLQVVQGDLEERLCSTVLNSHLSRPNKHICHCTGLWLPEKCSDLHHPAEQSSMPCSRICSQESALQHSHRCLVRQRTCTLQHSRAAVSRGSSGRRRLRVCC